MSEMFIKLLNMSISASILVVVVIALRCLLKKAPKRIICILWAFVALRLLCPVSISTDLSAFNLLDNVTGKNEQIEYFKYNGEIEKPKIEYKIPVPVVDGSSKNSINVNKHTSDIFLPAFIYVWLCGMAGMLAYSLVSTFRLKRKVRASIPIRGRIYVCDEVKCPFILGIIKPKIFVPSGIKSTTLTHVIAHEKAHIDRRDHWWKPFGYLLLTIYWFDPFIWLAYILFCRDIELSCDEKVIREMDRDGKAAYSQALLDCSFPRRMIIACPLAFGEIGVKERVKTVLNYKKPALWVIALAVAACIVTAVFFLTDPKGSTYKIKITIPAGSESGIYYSEEEICPKKGQITFEVGQDIGDTEISLLPVEAVDKNAYDESAYATPGLLTKMNAEKGSWFKVGINASNLNEKDQVVYVTVRNVEVRSVDVVKDEDKDEYKDEATSAEQSMTTLYAVISEIENDSMLVTPVEGSLELKSADTFSIPVKDVPSSQELQAGDNVEITYNGEILESYPAQFGKVYSIEIVKTPFDNIMGLSGYYTEKTELYFKIRSYYVTDTDGTDVRIAESFGFGINDFVVDLDGDGVTELVCNCQSGGDGHENVYVFRRNGSKIEQGYPDFERISMPQWNNWGVNSTASKYDEREGCFQISYSTENEWKKIKLRNLNDFYFEDYAKLQK